MITKAPTVSGLLLMIDNFRVYWYNKIRCTRLLKFLKFFKKVRKFPKNFDIPL